MSETLELVCIECREEFTLGKVWLADESSDLWRIDYLDADRTAQDYFMLAHRGHVLGVVGMGAIELASPESDIIESTYDLEEIRERHPQLHIAESEWLAPAGDLLAGLLRPRATSGAGPLTFSSQRTFRLWRAEVGHAQLLLRSTKSETEPTRVDLLFKPVQVMKLRWDLDGIDVRPATIVEAAEVTSDSGLDIEPDLTCFIVESGEARGYVVAGTFAVAEDEGAYGDPSAFDGPDQDR